MRYSTRFDLGGAADGRRDPCGPRSFQAMTPRTASSSSSLAPTGSQNGARRTAGHDRPCACSIGSVISCPGGGGLLSLRSHQHDAVPTNSVTLDVRGVTIDPSRESRTLPTLLRTPRGVATTNWLQRTVTTKQYRLVETSRHPTELSVRRLQAAPRLASTRGASDPCDQTRSPVIAAMSLCTVNDNRSVGFVQVPSLTA